MCHRSSRGQLQGWRNELRLLRLADHLLYFGLTQAHLTKLRRHEAEGFLTTFLTTFLTSFCSSLFQSFLPGVFELVDAIYVRSHIDFVFGFLFGCKGSNIRIIKQEPQGRRFTASRQTTNPKFT